MLFYALRPPPMCPQRILLKTLKTAWSHPPNLHTGSPPHETGKSPGTNPSSPFPSEFLEPRWRQAVSDDEVNSKNLFPLGNKS